MNPPLRKFFVGTLSFGALALGVSNSQAATWNWIGTNSNSTQQWETTTNWSLNGVPGGVGDILLIGTGSGHATLANTATTSTGSPSVIQLNNNRTVGKIYAGQANDRNISFHPGTGGSLTFDNGANDAVYMIRRDPASNTAASVAQLRGGMDSNMVLNSNLVYDAFLKRGYGTSPIGSVTMSNYINGTISGNGSLTLKVAMLTSATNATTNAFYSIEGGTGPNTHLGGTNFQKLTPKLGNGNNITTDVQSVYRLNKQHATGDGDMTVGAGATVLINTVGATGGAINDATTVSLEFNGSTRGLLAIAAGHNETVYDLFLNGVEQVNGTYGATGSGAQFILDDWFVTSIPFVGSGYTGILTVVPEPGATALGLLGSSLLFLRRRRTA